MAKRTKHNLRAGIFVLVGTLAVFAVVFILGRENYLFEDMVTYKVMFQSIGGLKPGAQVRLAGKTVGSVTDIRFSPQLKDKKIHVTITVKKSAASRIRKDSVVTIGSQGLLGDKVIELTIGSADLAAALPGSYLVTEEPPDYFQLLEKGQIVLDRAAVVAKDIDKILTTFNEKGGPDNLAGIIATTDNIMKEVEKGDGIAHALIYDREASSDVTKIIKHVKISARNINKGSDRLNGLIGNANVVAKDVDSLLKEVKHGQGTLHGLIYDDHGKKIVASLVKAADVIDDIVQAIHEEEGLIHALIYDDDAKQVLDELVVAARQIREITDTIKKGEGTVGAVIHDPTIYEDLKLLLGKVKRNKVLKALIRYALETDEKTDKKYHVSPSGE
ncbi:MAG: MlaD family protein [Pseudomonadota bacterium]